MAATGTWLRPIWRAAQDNRQGGRAVGEVFGAGEIGAYDVGVLLDHRPQPFGLGEYVGPSSGAEQKHSQGFGHRLPDGVFAHGIDMFSSRRHDGL